MKIGNIVFSSNLFLAPMAGVTDFAFRSLCRDFGAGLSYTEMVSAKGLIMSKKTEIYNKMLFTENNETPSVVQIFGSDPNIMAKACQHPLIQKFDIIDINMGCPAPKVVKNGDGSALLLDVDKAVEVAKACVNATTKPITVKMRSGFCKDKIVAIELAQKLEKIGVQAITIHARTREDMYSGKADLELIRLLKKAVKIPVIGNGDVVDQKSLQEMLKTGVDAVMIGRGSMGAPWIFKELQGQNVSNQEKFLAIKKHIVLLEKVFDNKYLTTYLRKHFLWYVKGFPNINKTKVSLSKTENLAEALKLIEQVFINNDNASCS